MRKIPLIACLALLPPSHAFAQACNGVPIGSGQTALTAGATFTTGVQSYGGNLNYRSSSPFIAGFGASYNHYSDASANGLGVGGSLGVEVPDLGFSLCPEAGVSYARVSLPVGLGETSAITNITVPVGLAFGITMPVSEAATITLDATPQYLYMRSKWKDLGLTDTSNEFGAVLGAAVGFRNLFIGGSVSFTTVENSDPAFGVGIGFPLGGN